MICTIYRQGDPVTGQLVAGFMSDRGIEIVEIHDKVEGLRLAKARHAVLVS